MKNRRRIASLSRARKCILHSWERTSSSIGKRASRISYFTEDSAVFRGKCTVSILSVSRGQAENIYRLREYYEIE